MEDEMSEGKYWTGENNTESTGSGRVYELIGFSHF